MTPAPLLLFDIGQAYQRSSDCTHAMEFYARYARAVPHPENRDELEQAIAKCKKPDQGKPIEGPPPPPPLPITAVAPAPQKRDTRRVVGYAVVGGGIVAGAFAVYFAADGARLSHQLQAETSWSPQDNAREARGKRDNTLAWVFASVGVAAVGGGVALAVTSRSGERAIAVAPTPGGAAVALTARF
jgi:hypothetical protein